MELPDISSLTRPSAPKNPASTVLVEETAASLEILRVAGRQRQLLRLGKLFRISDHAGGRSGA